MAKRTDEPTLPPRYVVGIDLGTTNSAMAFVDTDRGKWRVETFRIPQLVDAGTVEARETLPSCHYEPAAAEAGEALRLPWEASATASDHAVGVMARERGAEVPGRLAVSAKSWLSHAGVDRTSPLLPWHGAGEVRKLSPMEVSARYLAHLRRAWNHALPEQPLEQQDVVLTVPASFDEVARELTVEAAKKAGLPRVVLIEEPQAAFYSWMHHHGREGGASVEPGQTILVCDVGGGTTDLTLIRAEPETGGGVRFHRIAVGDHLILGGDNLDLALAHHLEDRLGKDGLSPRQWSVLVRRCQQAKEVLLGDDPPAGLTLNLPGSGSKLIGGALRVELGREEAQGLLVEGFLPRVGIGERPAPHESGFRQFGLPYAPDPAVTRYLGAFLSAHGDADETPVRPDVVLLNGGFFAAPALRSRLLDVLASWFSQDGSWRPRVLENPRLDLAVAQGAACFGMVRRGDGERISAGLAHTYYLGSEVDAETTAVCLVPAGLSEGEDVVVPERVFELLIREPVEFPIFTSSSRTTDRPGDLVPYDPGQLRSLPPIRTVLRSGKKTAAEKVAVHLHARLTEIGTLEVWCSEVQGTRTWRLQFDVRSVVATDIEQHVAVAERLGFVDEATEAECEKLIAATFGADGRNAQSERLVKKLEVASGLGRHDWPPSLLRAFWQILLDHEKGRGFSVNHEARWLNLLGYSLRPGHGYAVDDWRVARTWRLSHGGVVHARNGMCLAEWWILWRRIAGGLSSGQQRALAEPLISGLRSLVSRDKKSRFKPAAHELAEVWRLLGALEHLDPNRKVWLGKAALAEIDRLGTDAHAGAPLWSLARLGARVPVHGSPGAVVAVDTVETWIAQLLRLDGGRELVFALMQLARRTGDRYRDVSSGLRDRVLDRLAQLEAPAHYLELVRDVGELEAGEQRLVLGDSLPKGLVLRA